ncbi:MAG TPA: type II and III secretion system protein [bacterium]|nr:type II and III secretion system protein [bacterium]HPO09912.1 type II and III secretion system protein [bacterium]HQP98723.1 type II and III secretion system protein [bacterium]
MKHRLFFTVCILSFFLQARAWCAPPEPVAGSAYVLAPAVVALRDQLAQTFPMMALIEVRIIEVLSDSTNDLGFYYEMTGRNGRLRSSVIDLKILGSSDPGLRVQGILSQDSESQINAAIEMLATKREVTVWAEPSILTLMGQTAAIQSGDEIPYIKRVVVGYAETISSDFKPTGISLKVTPNILEVAGQRLVQMMLFANSSSVTRYREEEGYQQPITDTREFESTMAVAPGQYAVLGGIIRSTVSETRRGVPTLMDIPVVGMATRGKSQRTNLAELWIVVRPHIVNLETSQETELKGFQQESARQRQMALTGSVNLLQPPAQPEAEEQK